MMDDEKRADERRKNERIEYSTAIKCSKIISEGQAEIFDPPIEMSVKDIAPEGLCISSRELFKEGSILKFDIRLEDRLYRDITATIIWGANKVDTYYYGLHVQNMTGKFGIHLVEIGRKVSRNV